MSGVVLPEVEATPCPVCGSDLEGFDYRQRLDPDTGEHIGSPTYRILPCRDEVTEEQARAAAKHRTASLEAAYKAWPLK